MNENPSQNFKDNMLMPVEKAEITGSLADVCRELDIKTVFDLIGAYFSDDPRLLVHLDNKYREVIENTINRAGLSIESFRSCHFFFSELLLRMHTNIAKSAGKNFYNHTGSIQSGLWDFLSFLDTPLKELNNLSARVINGCLGYQLTNVYLLMNAYLRGDLDLNTRLGIKSMGELSDFAKELGLDRKNWSFINALYGNLEIFIKNR